VKGSVDVAGWILVAIAAVMGLLAAWLADSHYMSENTATTATYTVIVFAALMMALRPAWRRLRLWFDLLLLFVIHFALALRLAQFLNSHSIRLTWALALPFVAVEFLLFLGLLWRRNVSHSSP
jgi:hypothetical protein